MGQAKQRKDEIAKLKASKTTVKFLAIRHCEVGKPEFVHAQVEMGKPRNNKNDLLAHICMNDWLHNPPVSAIAEYLLQTKTYEMFSKMSVMGDAFIINFYEVDEEFTRRNGGKKTFSCRDIMAVPEAKLKAMAEQMAKELRADNDYSVNEYA